MSNETPDNRQQSEEPFKYFAFISYNAKDTAWGKRLQQKLEHYRMPATLCSEHGWRRTPLKPIFFAPTDIQPGGLTEELQNRLRASRNLIVICSPHSAQSQWVGKEIAFFHGLGRTGQIHFFIVDGEPHSDDPARECFNPVVDTLGMPEILAANIHEQIYRWPWMNRERAYVQLVSKLLGVEFDAIWQRHKRLLVKQAVAWCFAFIAVAAALWGVWVTNQPVDIEVMLHEATPHNPELPQMKDATVTLTIDNETKTDTLRTMKGSLIFTNIPHRYLGKTVSMSVRCYMYRDMDTTLTLTRHVTLGVHRDDSLYGHVHFTLWNPTEEKSYANARVTIEGVTATADDEGVVDLYIPLERQRTKYRVVSSLPLKTDTLPMPNNEYSILRVN